VLSAAAQLRPQDAAGEPIGRPQVQRATDDAHVVPTLLAAGSFDCGLERRHAVLPGSFSEEHGVEEFVIFLVAEGVVTDNVGKFATGEDHDGRANSKPVRDRDLEVVRQRDAVRVRLGGREQVASCPRCK